MRLISLIVALGLVAIPASAYALPIKGWCVLWLRTDRGIDVRGDAWDIQPNVALRNADVRDVLLLNEGPGHAAEITGFEGEMLYDGYVVPRYVWIIENWLGKVRTRKIPWEDAKIRGVYRPHLYTPLT